jgi:hypothetical protein
MRIYLFGEVQIGAHEDWHRRPRRRLLRDGQGDAFTDDRARGRAVPAAPRCNRAFSSAGKEIVVFSIAI